MGPPSWTVLGNRFQQGYFHVKNYYSVRYSKDIGRSKIWRAICEYLQKYIDQENDSVLDIGAGYCDFINNIKAKNKLAVDVNPEAREYCNENVDFYCSSVVNLTQINDNSIDVVFASNVLEHLNDNELLNCIQELRRILKSNAKLIVLQPNYRYAYREYFDDYTHKKVFSHISLSDLFRANGFTPLIVEKKFLPLTIKSRLPKSYWLTKFYINSPYKPMAKQMLLIFRKDMV